MIPIAAAKPLRVFSKDWTLEVDISGCFDALFIGCHTISLARFFRDESATEGSDASYSSRSSFDWSKVCGQKVAWRRGEVSKKTPGFSNGI